jgi:hypothetical protein
VSIASRGKWEGGQATATRLAGSWGEGVCGIRPISLEPACNITAQWGMVRRPLDHFQEVAIGQMTMASNFGARARA